MKDTTSILDSLYPLVEKGMKRPGAEKRFINDIVARYIQDNYEDLYDIGPSHRIPFNNEFALEQLESLLNLSKKDITNAIAGTYFHKIAKFNPVCAKDELTVLLVCIVRYFVLNSRNEKDIKLSVLYLSFSGKMYPSIHYNSFPKFVPGDYRHIMEYVVNKELSDKYDLKRTGSVIGAVGSIGETWLKTYRDMFKDFTDEDFVYLLQQLRDRMRSMMVKFAKVYIRVYENRDSYFTYDSDSVGEDHFRLADNDSLKATRIIEAVYGDINTSSGIDYKLCQMSVTDNNVKINELQSILETIHSDKDMNNEVKELIKIVIMDYLSKSKNKDVASNEFIVYTIKPKPNTKDPAIIRLQQLLESWLDEKSPNYRKRKNRHSTKLSYHKAVLLYYTLYINKVAKNL